MDEAVDMGRSRRRDDLLVGGTRSAVRNVVPDRPREQPGVLEDHPDPVAEVMTGHRGDIDPVKGDPATVELVEPHDEVDQRGLPRPGRADDRDGLPRLDDEVEVLDERLGLVIRERDVLEAHLAAVPGIACVRDRRDGVRRLLGRVEHLEDPLRRGDPDCSRFAIEATCVSGWVNWREYWMKAWTSPSEICPEATGDHR